MPLHSSSGDRADHLPETSRVKRGRSFASIGNYTTNMAYTKRQLTKILNVGTRPFIEPDHKLPYALRVGESLIRRRLYALEDETVAQQWYMYKAAYADIRNRAYDLAQEAGITTLENSGAVLRWRRSLELYTRSVATMLTDRIAWHSLKAAGNLYLLGYYGRAWALDVTTAPTVQVTIPQPSNRLITRAVLHPGISEDYDPDRQIYDLLGAEWRANYADQIDDMVRRIRGTLNTGISQRLDVRLLMQNVADVMGVNISRNEGFKANFSRVQALTRTYVMSASNEGALDLYRQNASLVSGVEFLAANDGRVCRMCARLSGTVWALDSDEIVRPPSMTHVNCRCTLIPRVIEGEPDAPRMTWKDWVLSAGLGWLLGDELTDIDLGDDIDSSQIGDDEAEFEDVV
jgi:SPP1 gp7 family putative phage head morphogenesis protein